MASAEMNPELCCSLCHNIYTDPVTLKCGHNFCRICMENKLKEQDENGFYTCPTCQKRFSFSNRLMHVWSTQESSSIPCMFCSLPSFKRCLQCGGSVCDEHLATHNKTHRLIDPTAMEDRRCPEHDKLLDHYCMEDDACICPDCSVLGDHKGHNVESLDEACKKKKEKMQNVLQNLVSKREDNTKKMTELIIHKSTEMVKAHLQQEQVIGQFTKFIQQIENVKNKFLMCTSHQKDQIEQSIQKQINTLREHDQQLSTRIDSTKELYKMDDALFVLQNLKFDEEIGNPQEMDDMQLPTLMKIDDNQLLHEFNSSISNMLQCLPIESTTKTGPTITEPYHKGVYSKEEKLKSDSPNEGESSSVVPNIMSYTPKRKPDQLHGSVWLYCKKVTNYFLIHIYLVTEHNYFTREFIAGKDNRGFLRIEKPSYIDLVSMDITYNIEASEGVIIENKNLHCLYSVSEEYPYAAIRVPEKYSTVTLHISEEGKKEKIWSCVLNEDDLHELPGISSFFPSSSHDLHRMAGFPQTISSPSDSGMYSRYQAGARSTYSSLSDSGMLCSATAKYASSPNANFYGTRELQKHPSYFSQFSVHSFPWPKPKLRKIPEPRIKDTKATTSLSIYGNTYRLNMKSSGLFCCSEMGIQFQVRGPMTIEYELVSWSKYMTDTLSNGYQIISPLFNINKQGSSLVSAVYLPHCLSSKDYDTYKSYIKFVHFKDGKMILESPMRIEPSYIVLENPTFSYVGVLIEKFWTFIMRSIAFNGIVLIYGKAERNFRLRLYTMINYQPNIKKIIDKEIGEEFRWIDKAPQVESVYTERPYVIQGLSEAKIEPEVLRFWFTFPSKVYPYTEITLSEPSDNIDLCIAEEDSGQIIWRRHLTKDDLTKTPATSSTCSSASDSGKAKTFLQNNYEALCQRLGLLEPILLSLRARGIINEHEEESIRRHNLTIEQNKALLQMVTSKGVGEQFYKILMDKDPYLVQSLKQPTTEN